MKKLVLTIFFLLCGCSTHMTDITLISNKNIELDTVDLDKAPKVKNVEGKDSKFIFFFIPFGRPKIQEAVNDALQKGNGDLITDASIYAEGWWFLVGEQTIKVKGTVVNTKGAKK